MLDFSNAADYDYNGDIIKDGCVTKALIFGINGSGKSNLALAVFDIILHLTDKERALDKYQHYLNMDSDLDFAEFEYVFTFDGTEVVYLYRKHSPLDLVYEELKIAGDVVLQYDFTGHSGVSRLQSQGVINLMADDVIDDTGLSRVKYVKSNAMLKNDEVNRAFRAFTTFVDNMLMFYSLSENRYQGLLVGTESYTHEIIKAGKLKDFEEFLRENGIDYELMPVDTNGRKEIYCRFANAAVQMFSIASTGTKSLALFYYWYIKMGKASFVYIDEYDAFYHFELSQKIVELVKALPDTQVVLSTHNTDLISNDLLRPDAYFEIKDNEIKSFDKITDREIKKVHNLQKMYKAGEFDG